MIDQMKDIVHQRHSTMQRIKGLKKTNHHHINVEMMQVEIYTWEQMGQI